MRGMRGFWLRSGFVLKVTFFDETTLLAGVGGRGGEGKASRY